MTPKIFLLATATSTLLSLTLSAQSTAELQDLTKTIASMDSTFFHAFNMCDVETSKSLFTEDLEFYHDAGGLTNYTQNLNSITRRCDGETKVRRELVEGSLEVFPIKDFGAIEIGRHRFYYTEKGKQEKLDGTFKFVHIWKNVKGSWKMCRVISYDH
ncbi:nuclear transport factor 2 family protein [Chryseolinea lacunae]|uniref:Nuclear transport factor 2 family protein n=1 Tax=Chryseolinea lacunae TaxID=2801331 RepID=A0ABS1L1S8_9BACT|nr:nuclear transport factor 2 family protein [Chryseolinea lacunae]MBL0745668.1 nuclear transport factor 2 family protein [Chryseolinea lacunae]